MSLYQIGSEPQLNSKSQGRPNPKRLMKMLENRSPPLSSHKEIGRPDSQLEPNSERKFPVLKLDGQEQAGGPNTNRYLSGARNSVVANDKKSIDVLGAQDIYHKAREEAGYSLDVKRVGPNNTGSGLLPKHNGRLSSMEARPG